MPGPCSTAVVADEVWEAYSLVFFRLEIIDGAGVNLHIAHPGPTAKPLDLRDSLLSGELSAELVQLRDFKGRQKEKSSEISQIQVWRKSIPIRTSGGLGSSKGCIA